MFHRELITRLFIIGFSGIAVTLSVSCVRQRTAQLLSQCINQEISFDGLVPTYAGKVLSNRTGVLPERIRLVVYLDSIECQRCRLLHMDEYIDFLKLESEQDSLFDFMMIMSPSKEDKKSVLHELYVNRLFDVVYLDFQNQFATNNDFIPEDSRFHVFLLDKDNKVIIVGDPAGNEKMRAFFLGKIYELI